VKKITRNEFALIPTKLSNKKWIWLKWFKRVLSVTEHEGFEEGVGNITFRTYKTLFKI
jgi:hypothetical protein